MGHSTNLLLIRSGLSYKWSLFFISSHLFFYYNDINSFFYKSLFYLYFLFKFKYFKSFFKKGLLFSHLNFCLLHNNQMIFNIFLYDKNYFRIKKKFYRIFKYKLRHVYNKKNRRRKRRFFKKRFFKNKFVLLNTSLKKFLGYRIYGLKYLKDKNNYKKIFDNIRFLKYFLISSSFIRLKKLDKRRRINKKNFKYLSGLSKIKNKKIFYFYNYKHKVLKLNFFKYTLKNLSLFSFKSLNFKFYLLRYLKFILYNSFRVYTPLRTLLKKVYKSAGGIFFFNKKVYKRKYKMLYYVKRLFFEKLYKIFLSSFFVYNKNIKKISFNFSFFFYLIYLFFFFFAKRIYSLKSKNRFNIFFFFFKKKKRFNFKLKRLIFKKLKKILKKTKKLKINRFIYIFFFFYCFFCKIVKLNNLKLFKKFLKFFYKLFFFWCFFKFIKRKLLFFYKKFFYKKLVKFFFFKLRFFIKQKKLINLKFNILSRLHLSGYLFLVYWKWKLKRKYTVNKIIWPFFKRRLKNNLFLKGFNFIISGRFTKRQRALIQKISIGRLSYKTIFAPVYFYSKAVITRYGTCNFKLTIRYNKRFFFRNLNNYFLVKIF